MRITFQSQENIQNTMRRCGYFFSPSEASAKAGRELAFIRPLSSSGSGYPRFHAYVYPVKSDSPSEIVPKAILPGQVGAKQFNRVNMEKFPRETVINLHLDQKKPIYHGATAHAGEYDGELVEKELARMKKILGS